MIVPQADKPPITDLLPPRYERSTALVRVQPIVRPRYTPPPTVSGAILLIGFLAVLFLALTHICLIGATEPQAVAWACIVAGVLAALRKWA
jgi:hypothetical protein